MTTGIQCRADPRCTVPAPSETGICHCHGKQAKKAGSAIRKLSAHGDALVTPGKPTLVASIDDPSGQLRYVVNVTATRLR